ncbi:MAG: nucleoside-triphosphatase [Ferruginibacter sp.]
MSIYIFSRPIRSGKTTELLEWSNLQKNIAGILMPDINGCRKIFNIHTKEVFEAECIDPAITDAPLTAVGKFHFYTAAFEKGNSIVQQAFNQAPGWLIIDEAGKLELKGQGFYPAVADAVKLYSNKDRQGNLLITVRDSLCEEVISFFSITDCKVIDRLDSIR